jgi:two-component system, NarL family, sensor histidine kinase UhpB
MTEQSPAVARADAREDRLVLLRGVAIVAVGYGFGAALQSTYIYSDVVPAWRDVSIWARLGANGLAIVFLILALAALGMHRVRRLPMLALGAVVASLLTAVVRFAAQVALGVYPHPTADDREAELAGGFVIAMISTGIGLWAMRSRGNARRRTRAAEREAVQVEVAVRALEQEEVRVRRAVAEGLHGTLQQKLVLVDARLADVLDHAKAGTLSEADVEALRWVRAELDEARETDVREMSRLLYPDRLELGLVPAVRALLSRIPTSIGTQLTVSPGLRALDDPAAGRLTTAERLVAARVVEEGVTNALKHGPAANVTVALDDADGVLIVAVENDGELYDPDAAGSASGTARLGHRLSLMGGTLTLGPGARNRGARLEARLPLAGSDGTR